MTATRIRCGVAGTGSLGQHHARIYSTLPGAELAVEVQRVTHAALQHRDGDGPQPAQRLINPVGARLVGNSGNITTTIQDDGTGPLPPGTPDGTPPDNDTPAIGSIVGGQAVEGGNLDFQITLTNPSKTDTPITLNFGGGTATPGADMDPPLVSFDGGLTFVPVTVDSLTNGATIVVPANTPGITVVRALSVFGYDDAPHGHMEVLLKNVRVPAENILLGEGRGFEIAQGRLGPGRIHHCMRTIGVAERALELMCHRLNTRVAFGREVARQTVWQERVAESRCMIEQARLLTLKAAYMMDTVGNKVAKAEIAMIKIVAPQMACQIIDWAIQAHGGGGVSQDFPLAYAYAHQRTLRLADGPDEVHRNSLAKLELAKQLALPGEVDMPITRGS